MTLFDAYLMVDWWDDVQVRNLAEHFARLDEKGQLGNLFSCPAGITDEERRAVECEEGWILGIR